MSELPIRKKRGGGAASGAKRKRAQRPDSLFDSDGDGEDEDEYHQSDEDEQEDEDEDGLEEEEEEASKPRSRASKPPAKKRKVAPKEASPGASKSAPARVLPGSDADDSEVEDPTRTTNNGVILERPSVAFQRRKREAKKQKRKMKDGDIKGDSSTDTAADELRSVVIPANKAKAYAELRKKAARSTARVMDRSVVRRSRDFPPRKDEDFKRLIPKPKYDEHWTRDDQRDLEERLSGDADFEKQCNAKTIVVGVWKTVYRFTGRLATDVIGPRTNLEFQSNSKKGKKADGPVWTEKLCEALPDIVLHPMFNLDTAKVALALQWAVICRTGDKRKYRLSGCRDDLFLQRLVSVIDKYQDDSTSPRYLRELALYKHKGIQDPGVGPPAWCELLRHIENKTKAQGEEVDGGAHLADGEPYLVSLADVYAVRSALDRMMHASMRQNLGARLISGAIMPSREISDVPNMALTKMAIRAVLLHKERNKERARRGGPPESLPTPTLDRKRPSKDGVNQDSGSGGDEDTPDDDPFAQVGNGATVPAMAPKPPVPRSVWGSRGVWGLAGSRGSSQSLGESCQDAQPLEDEALRASDDGGDVLFDLDDAASIVKEAVMSRRGLLSLGGAGGSSGTSLEKRPGPDKEPASKPKPGEGKSAIQKTSAPKLQVSSNKAHRAPPSKVGDNEPQGASPWPLAPNPRVRVRGLEQGSIDIRYRSTQRLFTVSSSQGPQNVPSIYPGGLAQPTSEEVLAALRRTGGGGAVRDVQPGQTFRTVLIDK